MVEAHRLMRTGVVSEICVKGAAAALDFYTEAFGAEELFRQEAPDGRIIADGYRRHARMPPPLHGGRGRCSEHGRRSRGDASHGARGHVLGRLARMAVRSVQPPVVASDPGCRPGSGG